MTILHDFFTIKMLTLYENLSLSYQKYSLKNYKKAVFKKYWKYRFNLTKLKTTKFTLPMAVDMSKIKFEVLIETFTNYNLFYLKLK